MGQGIEIGCKCRRKELMLGVGMMHPMVYQETMNKIRSGKHGSEMQDLVKSRRFIAADVEMYAYWCDGCGWIDSLMALDLYEPKDVEKVRKRVVNRWSAGDEKNKQSVEEAGDLPYFTVPDEDYQLLKEYKHVCPKCGKVMRKIDAADLEKKGCPKCGEKYKVEDSFILWD